MSVSEASASREPIAPVKHHTARGTCPSVCPAARSSASETARTVCVNSVSTVRSSCPLVYSMPVHAIAARPTPPPQPGADRDRASIRIDVTLPEYQRMLDWASQWPPMGQRKCRGCGTAYGLVAARVRRARRRCLTVELVVCEQLGKLGPNRHGLSGSPAAHSLAYESQQLRQVLVAVFQEGCVSAAVEGD